MKAPEQRDVEKILGKDAERAEYGLSADIYSFGVIMADLWREMKKIPPNWQLLQSQCLQEIPSDRPTFFEISSKLDKLEK